MGEDDRKQIADTTHGYVGADILCLCQQGTSCLAEYDQNYRGMKQLFVCHNFCLWNITANINAIKREIEDVGKGTKIKLCDVTAAMTTIQPSAMREIQLEIPKVSKYLCKIIWICNKKKN